MKTLCRFFNEEVGVFFFELDGDYSHLNEVYINGSADKKLKEELYSLMFDAEEDMKIKKLLKPTKDWDVYIECGWWA